MILTDQSRDAVQFWVIRALSFPRILITWLQAEDVLLPQNQKWRLSVLRQERKIEAKATSHADFYL